MDSELSWKKQEETNVTGREEKDISFIKGHLLDACERLCLLSPVFQNVARTALQEQNVFNEGGTNHNSDMIYDWNKCFSSHPQTWKGTDITQTGETST